MERNVDRRTEDHRRAAVGEFLSALHFTSFVFWHQKADRRTPALFLNLGNGRFLSAGREVGEDRKRERFSMTASSMDVATRRDIVYLALAGFFVTNAILGELTGGKLFTLGPFTMSIGVIPWPVVFIATDLINEYFGRDGVRRLTFMTIGLIAYAFIVLYVAIQVPAASFSPVTDAQFDAVFGQSLWIIAGSITAFAASQLIDVGIFWLVRHKTGGKHLWMRATGSTVVSQLIDSVVIIGIAFWLPGKVKTAEFFAVAGANYSYKLLIALGVTPLLYVAHAIIDRFLGLEEAHRLIDESAQASEEAAL
jgi:queuosine precursor transporter